MKQQDLNQSVARATGDSISTIKRLGFLLAAPTDSLEPDDEHNGPFVIDWDELAAERNLSSAWSRKHEPVVAY